MGVLTGSTKIFIAFQHSKVEGREKSQLHREAESHGQNVGLTVSSIAINMAGSVSVGDF